MTKSGGQCALIVMTHSGGNIDPYELLSVFKACRDWGQLVDQGLSPVTVGLDFSSFSSPVPSQGRACPQSR